ncbi:M3 family oligoendopeptidase [Pseudoleptotrichia goodfellowii]|uniref:Oligoendopeptidase, M3 family n=2 Tax=Pseudoleptotrichia goodfellowii TaxID=157692 RepID=D0GN84_9FUSO|nr:M3 family oligoendopeptidase [Pseudoleptotrichia goodfellowii]EEY34473.1 oligoendopeptidase, M3 family [Pseudoleptotrichia goodfellowii F0264]BBM35191.1 oligoendopeptidase [Pseudoleptotrichia goodfellowii]
MNFNDYKYERVNIDTTKEQFGSLIGKFTNASNVEEQCKYMDEIIKLRNHVETMSTLVSVRHSIDTVDEFYDKENDYYDENGPVLQSFVMDFYKALTTSKFRKELEEKYGKFLFDLAECSLKTFDEKVIPDLQEENKLVSKYQKLIASAKIEFDGGEKNLSEMVPYAQSKDRNIRKDAAKKVAQFFSENKNEFDDIYDKLVKVRNGIAHKLGFKNYIELAYALMSRLEYNAADVAGYRKQVLENIVPVHSELRKRQAKRLGLDKLTFYDEPIKFNSGNADPHGEPEWILNHGKTMYHELSKETDEFFTFMTENNLLDLLSKKGKMSGGYCTYIPDYKSPFIFANFNGTAHDVDVLTHEAGHAFQVYESRKYEVPEYLWPSYEACEIHSMSMEFLTWPWMKLFFENDTDKYKFIHLSESLLFIPYGVTVDEFQHWVYENPEATPEQRRNQWIEIEKKYLPTRDYGEIDELKEGIFWFRQGHIFASPFYYIDYTLAQVCAFQFLIKSVEDRENAWKEYLALCRLGGSKPFFELMKAANLKNPFTEGTLSSVIPKIREILNGFNDTEM